MSIDDTSSVDSLSSDTPLSQLLYRKAAINFSVADDMKSNTLPLASSLATASALKFASGQDKNDYSSMEFKTTMKRRKTSEGGDDEDNSYLTENSTRYIQDLLDADIAAQSKSWRGSIPFQCYVFGVEGNDDKNDPFKSPIMDIDICDFLNGASNAERLYFCPKTYFPPDLEAPASNCASWELLKQDLGNAAHSAGSPIVSNGGGARGRKSFKCQVIHRSRESLAMQLDENRQHRGTSLVNDALENSRGKKGKSMPRKRNIAFDGTTCKFNFDVKWDQYGYFVNLFRGAGNPTHNNHPKPIDPTVIPYPSHLLSTKKKEEIRNAVAASQSYSVGRNYVLKSVDKFFNAAKVAFLNRKTDNGTHEGDDISMMLHNFKQSKEIAFTTMSDIPIDMFESLPDKDENINPQVPAKHENMTLTVSTTKDHTGEIIINRATDIDGLSPLEAVAKKTRVERKICSSQYLFMSIAWIYLPAFRYFQLCPEVVWCDVTSHSNNLGFKLLTFSCRTSINKQVVFMYIWIPNEQRISFRWVFSHAIPQLVPAWLRSRVRFIMKDGDPQQRNEILISLQSVFPNASEGVCGWHVVQQGWKRHVPGEMSISYPNRQ